jgi:putative tricarboxylic transport membrane protein
MFSLGVCAGGLRLGFGTFPNPKPGFMPFLSGLFLGLLALGDLVSGAMGGGGTEKEEEEIWRDINWRKLISTFAALFLYAASLSKVGFVLGTTLLLCFLFRMMRPRPWWVILCISACTTGLFYLGFGIVLGIPMPEGFAGF